MNIAFIATELFPFSLALVSCLAIGFAVPQTRTIVTPQGSSWAVPTTVIVAALVAAYLAFNPGERLDGVMALEHWQAVLDVMSALLVHPALIVPIVIGLFVGVRVEQGFIPMVFYPLLAAVTIGVTTFAYSYSLVDRFFAS